MIHNVLFVFSLSIIGFAPMMESIFLACWAYSCYLTMNECQILLYVFFVIASVSTNFYVERRDLAPDVFEMIGYLILYVIYGFMLYFLCSGYYRFRHTGGLKGNYDQHGNLIERDNLIEDQLSRRANSLIKKAGEGAANQLEMADANRQKKDEKLAKEHAELAANVMRKKMIAQGTLNE